MYLVCFPLTIVNGAIRKQDLTLAAPLIFIPFSIIYGSILIIIDASPVSHDFANVLGSIIVDQLILDSLGGFNDLSDYALDLILVQLVP
jgi:hypothetical protein